MPGKLTISSCFFHLFFSKKSHFYILQKVIFVSSDVCTRVIGKDSDAGRDWGQEEKGKTEDEMAG